jgi:hypothetical protein
MAASGSTFVFKCGFLPVFFFHPSLTLFNSFDLAS